MKSKQLALRKNYFNPTVWKQMETMAQTLIQSKAMPKGIQNAAQAIMVMQAGYEMGMMPLQAINGLTIINGVITTHGKETIRRVREHGWKIKYTEAHNKCTAIVSKDRESYEDTFTFEDAEKSHRVHQYRKDAQTGAYARDENKQLIKDLKAGWYDGENRIVKLRYGVISKILKTYIPEVLGSTVDITEVAEDYPLEDITVVEETSPNKIVSPPSDRPDLKTFIATEKAKTDKNKNPTGSPKTEVKKEEKPAKEEVKNG